MADSSSAHTARDSGPKPAPAGDGGAELRRRLDLARRELLDLTARNRLLHTPRRSSRTATVEIVGERSVHAYRRLVVDGRGMSFEAASDTSPTTENTAENLENSAGTGVAEKDRLDTQAIETCGANADAHGQSIESSDPPLSDRESLEQPEDKSIEEHAERDDRLQTMLPSSQLQKRLLRTFYSARTFEEEQGVNVLYLALGFLKWLESDKPGGAGKERYAPLLLVPVEIERPSVASRFCIRWSGEEITTNLSLQVKLRAEFRLDLPSVDRALDADDELDPAKYFDLVRKAIDGHRGWQVLDDDMVLGFSPSSSC